MVRLSSSTTDALGMVVDHVPTDLRFDGRTALFREGGTVYEARARRAVPVLAPGDETPAGTIAFTESGDYEKAFAFSGGELIVSSRLFGGDASEALVTRTVGRGSRR